MVTHQLQEVAYKSRRALWASFGLLGVVSMCWVARIPEIIDIRQDALDEQKAPTLIYYSSTNALRGVVGVSNRVESKVGFTLYRFYLGGNIE